MTPSTSKRRLRIAVVTVMVVGVIATVAGFVVAVESNQQNNGILLRQDTAQANLVLQGLESQLTDPFAALGRDVATNGSGQAAFWAAADALHGQNGSSVALLHVEGGQLSVAGSTGPLHRGFTGKAATTLVGLLGRAPSAFTGVTAAGGMRWLGQIFGPPDTPAGYAIYAETPVDARISLSSISGLPFSGLDGALYLGSESPGNLVFASTRHLPLTGERAVGVLPTPGAVTLPAAQLSAHVGSLVAPGRLILVMRANRDLSGPISAALPWAVLVVGLVFTIVVAFAADIALRRRDQAFELVEDLEGKNAALDRALTSQAQAEESLRQSQRLEAVGQLAGGIAHDFNNLLHVILSYSDFLSDGIEPDSALQADVGEVKKAAARAAELTKQLLIFSRRDVVTPVTLDVNDVVRGTERLLERTLGEDIDLVCATADAPCPVIADPGELEQVMMNLAFNARDAMPKGGRLTIEVRAVNLDVGPAFSAGLGGGPHVEILVGDTGTGMTPEVAARAFEPFFTTKETGRGTGLGLAMVYGIVSRWHGNVSIRSAPGLGTTVTVLFPFSDVAVTGRADGVAAAKDKAVAKRAGTVLLVEDEDGVRRSTARILHSAGYEVLEAADAAHAIRRFESSPVDVVVTDVIMPGGMSGKELADRLHRESPALPVVFVSGYNSETVAERVALPFWTAVVEKPFTSETLLAALDAARRGRETVLR